MLVARAATRDACGVTPCRASRSRTRWTRVPRARHVVARGVSLDEASEDAHIHLSVVARVPGAHAGAVLITAFCSWLFFDLHPNMFFMLGMLASVCSLFLYYSERLSPELAARFEAAVDSATSRLRDGELGYGALAIVKKPSKELEA